jgi:hypothetical protein
LQDTRRRDHVSGLDTIQYDVMSQQELLIDSAPVTILNVQLSCDMIRTPWCVNPDQLETALNDLSHSLSAEAIAKIRNELSKYKSYQPFLAQH